MNIMLKKKALFVNVKSLIKPDGHICMVGVDGYSLTLVKLYII